MRKIYLQKRELRDGKRVMSGHWKKGVHTLEGNQCCGSMTFWCGSGFGVGSGSFFFFIDLQDANKKLILFTKSFSAYCFLKVLLHHFLKVKSKTEVTKQYFCFMIEGSGAVSGSGSIPLTNGSGSGRPKNKRIRWIRIRIRNTEGNTEEEKK